MPAQNVVTISKEEYDSLKRKAAFAEDVLLQLDSSLRDIKEGRIRKAVH